MHLAPERLILDSETVSHWTPNEDRLHSVTECSVEIHLEDNSTVSAKEQGASPVSWLTDQGYKKVNLSETIIAPNLSKSLLSVPTLSRKNRAVLFMPKVATLFDLKDNYAVLVSAS